MKNPYLSSYLFTSSRHTKCPKSPVKIRLLSDFTRIFEAVHQNWCTTDSVSFGQILRKMPIRKISQMPFWANAGLGFCVLQRKSIYGILRPFSTLLDTFYSQKPVFIFVPISKLVSFLFSSFFSNYLGQNKCSNGTRKSWGPSEILEPQGLFDRWQAIVVIMELLLHWLRNYEQVMCMN